jgi:serine phosphatase RsbU (regulator of sigma subunit)
VSGKGTSAAFNMSQMKGVFHSLVQLNLPPVEFMVKANNALSDCLEKNHFITTTYYSLNTAEKDIRFARAGHCPTLYYDVTKDESSYLDVNGMGLGIVRNERFVQYLEEGYLRYHPGDIMVMYTDGIIEAKNEKGEEFGFEALRSVLHETKDLCARQIKEEIIQRVHHFIGKNALPDDDYSLMVVKFTA